MATDTEKWIKIRTVLDMIAYSISLYKSGRIEFRELVNLIYQNVSEVFGISIARDVVSIVNEERVETGEALRKIQEFLVRKLIEGVNNEKDR